MVKNLAIKKADIKEDKTTKKAKVPKVVEPVEKP